MKLWKKCLLILSFFGLGSCTTLDQAINRGPASISTSCNRQILGETAEDNAQLKEFNRKRIDVMNELLKTRINLLRSKTSDASVINRIMQLEKSQQALNGVKAWDEPNEVSYKLKRALATYLSDASSGVSASALTSEETNKLKYAKETIEPNLTSVEYWMPDFCKSLK